MCLLPVCRDSLLYLNLSLFIYKIEGKFLFPHLLGKHGKGPVQPDGLFSQHQLKLILVLYEVVHTGWTYDPTRSRYSRTTPDMRNKAGRMVSLGLLDTHLCCLPTGVPPTFPKTFVGTPSILLGCHFASVMLLCYYLSIHSSFLQKWEKKRASLVSCRCSYPQCPVQCLTCNWC